MADARVISADSHFVEPPDMWAERVDKKFRDRAPHTVKGYGGREGEFFVCENIAPIPVAGFSAQACRRQILLRITGRGLKRHQPVSGTLRPGLRTRTGMAYRLR